MKNAAFLILFLLVFPFRIFAGNDGAQIVTGRVFDEQSREALAGVEVVIKETGKVIYTDFEGYFTIAGLTADQSVTLEFHYLTYNAAQTVTLPVSDDLKIVMSQRP